MKEIVVVSGKGGTGKTSISTALSVVAGRSAVIADCDVDAADMHLILDPEVADSMVYYGGKKAAIDPELCRNCGRCADVCAFDAIDMIPGRGFSIDTIACEGCGLCTHYCPFQAISMEDEASGSLYLSTARTAAPMVHARLNIGAENSGKLVTRVKAQARSTAEARELEWIIVDGSPGTGCPVVSSLSGAAYVLLVTEPTVSGFHDLKRVMQLVKRFNLTAGGIINKSDLNADLAEQLRGYLKREGVPILAEFPYSREFPDAIVAGKSIVEISGEFRRSIEEVLETIQACVNQAGE